MGILVKPEKERECGCCINIEDCFVLIICGEIDVDSLKNSLKTFVEVKGNAKSADQE
jgi:Holliday junction resolvase-like predicted endonuclease